MVLFFVWPLALKNLSTNELAIWALFSTVFSLQVIVDSSLADALTRLVAQKSDSELFHQVVGTVRSIFSKVCLIVFVLLCIFGTLSVKRLVLQSSQIVLAWISWGVVVSGFMVSLFSNQYVVLIGGLNHVVNVKRIDFLTGFGAAFLTTLFLALGGGLLSLVFSTQLGAFVRYLLLKNEFVKIEKNRSLDQNRFIKSEAMSREVWPMLWKGWLGVLFTFGLTQLSGIFYAQVASAKDVAAYLIALRFAQMISVFSLPPFDTKIPLLAKLYPKKCFEEMRSIFTTAMQRSYWVFVLGFIVVTVLIPNAFKFLNKDFEFVNLNVWALMGLGFFLERYSNMHLQLYTLSNHVLWHVSSFVFGTLYVLFCIFLFPNFGVIAFPLSFCLGQIIFSIGFSAKKSYGIYGHSIPMYELKTFFPPLITLLLFLGFFLWVT